MKLGSFHQVEEVHFMMKYDEVVDSWSLLLAQLKPVFPNMKSAWLVRLWRSYPFYMDQWGEESRLTDEHVEAFLSSFPKVKGWG